MENVVNLQGKRSQVIPEAPQTNGACSGIQPTCRYCDRTLQTEDERRSGYCMRHIPKEWPVMVCCPKFKGTSPFKGMIPLREKIGAADCRFQRRYNPTAGGMNCADCGVNPDNDPLKAAKGILVGLIISLILIGGAYLLYLWLR